MQDFVHTQHPTPDTQGTPAAPAWSLLGAMLPLILAVMLLLTLSFVANLLTNAARAYVGSENLWSNSQAEAVRLLVQYAREGDEAVYREYEDAARLAAGSRIAREALQAPAPDEARAREGFLQSGSDPQDIAGMVTLYRLFHRHPTFAEALRLWASQNEQVDQLIALGRQLKDSGRAGAPQALMQIRTIYARMKALDEHFAAAVGRFSRELTQIILLVKVAAGAAMLALGTWLSWRLLRRMQRAEQQLQRAHDRLALATSSAGSGVWDWDARAHTLYASAQLREVLGQAHEEEVRPDRMMEALTHPDDAPGVREAIRAHLAGASPKFDVEMRLRHADGRYTWFHARGRATFDANGRALRLLGTLTDIDRRKQAEQELRDALALLQQTDAELDLALMGAGVALWTFEPATGRVTHTRRWASLLGHDEMPADFDDWQQTVHPADRGRRQAALQDHLEGRTDHYECEFRSLHADGHWVHVRSRGQVTARAPDGTPLHFAGVAMDVSAQVTARQAEQDQAQFLQAMINGVDTGVMVSDSTCVVFANSRLRSLLGWGSTNGVVGLPVLDLFHPDDREAVRTRRQKALEGAQVPVGLVRMVSRGGRTVEVAINVTVFNWKGVAHLINSISPLSEQDMLGAHLRSERTRFDKALLAELEAQQAHLARELHDSLGSVLAGISLMVGGLKPLAAGNEALHKQIGSTQEQVRVAAEMTRALARGLMPVGSHPGGFLRALEQLAEDLTLIKGVECTLEVEGDFEGVRPEVGIHLYRIAQEAISNAVRHGRATEVNLKLTDEGAFRALRIEDNGKGFDVAGIARDHPGLGLQAMTGRAKSIGGSIDFLSSEAGGSAILVVWPTGS